MEYNYINTTSPKNIKQFIQYIIDNGFNMI